MRIVAEQPKDAVLVLMRGDVDYGYGRVFDLRTRKLQEGELRAASIIRAGYWEPPTMSEDEQQAILAEAAELIASET